MKQLMNFTSFDKAYEVADYPYGFKLRCKIRYWIESNPKFGQRFVSCTQNPKTSEWNSAHAHTYNRCVVMYLDEENHVKQDLLSATNTVEQFEAFIHKWTLTAEQRKSLELDIKIKKMLCMKQTKRTDGKAPSYSKGPWKIEHDVFGTPKGYVTVGNRDKIALAQVVWEREAGKLTKNEQANAYLIVSAPEMYEALETVKTFLDSEHITTDFIEEILAKARGDYVTLVHSLI